MVEADNNKAKNTAEDPESPIASMDVEEEEKESSYDPRDNNRVKATRDDELVINTSEQLQIVSSFDQLGLPENLLKGKFSLECNGILLLTLF